MEQLTEQLLISEKQLREEMKQKVWDVLLGNQPSSLAQHRPPTLVGGLVTYNTTSCAGGFYCACALLTGSVVGSGIIISQ